MWETGINNALTMWETGKLQYIDNVGNMIKIMQSQQNVHALSKDSDQPGHPPSLTRVCADSLCSASSGASKG